MSAKLSVSNKSGQLRRNKFHLLSMSVHFKSSFTTPSTSLLFICIHILLQATPSYDTFETGHLPSSGGHNSNEGMTICGDISQRLLLHSLGAEMVDGWWRMVRQARNNKVFVVRHVCPSIMGTHKSGHLVPVLMPIMIQIMGDNEYETPSQQTNDSWSTDGGGG